jgi:putative intracellular protease/amidase
MKNRKIIKAMILVTVISVFIFNACKPLKEFGTMPVYQGKNNYAYHLPAYDSLKKTVIILANNDGTELFDLIAPYYIFNASEKANVYIVAKNKFPIVVRKGFFLLPQFTLTEIDSLGIKPDLIVIPFLSAIDSAQQDRVVLNWIKKHYSAHVNLLSVCDGSATAAATGIFDGKPITAHASDFQVIKSHFSKPLWVQNKSVVNSGNLYSTGGVSNATEGSLVLVNKLFGPQVTEKVIEDINYPYQFPKIEHGSNTFHFGNKATIGKKIIFNKNRRIGILLQNGINEFNLAAIMDTYNRTFPKSFESFSANDLPVITKYGLTVIPTGIINNAKLDEVHVIDNIPFSKSEELVFKSAEIVKYNQPVKQYIIGTCLERIRLEYGSKFEKVVKLMLDYN